MTRMYAADPRTAASPNAQDRLVPLKTRRTARARAVRVALVVEAAGGGVAVHVADMIRGLCALGGFEINLVVPQGPRFDSLILAPDVLASCNTVHRLPMARSVGGSDVIAFAQLFKCLHRINPDIVHSHSSKAGALARMCLGPWKQVYTPHAVFTLNPFLPRAQRRFYGLVETFLGRLFSDRIIAVSVDEAEHLQHRLHIPARRIETIFNGVPEGMTRSRGEARKLLGLSSQAVVVGFVARLDFQKGVDRLLRVAQNLLKRGIDDVVFAVMGPGDFARAAGVRREDIPGNIRVLGPVPQARSYFSAFDIFAMPSRYEGFPYVVLEAMAAHVPIVSTRVSGAAELVGAEQVGFVVPNEDNIAAFTDATITLSQDAALRRHMSQNCERAVRRYSVAAMVDRTVDVYQSLLKECN